MRLALLITSLGPGGAERVLSHLASVWVAEGQQVTLITLGATGEDFYPLDARVQRVGLDLLRDAPHPLVGLWRMAVRVWRLRRCLGRLRPDVVVSFTVSVNLEVLLATRALGMPVIVSERNEPQCQTLDRLRRALRRRLYPLASAVVVQTAAIAAWFHQHVPSAKIWVIANPVLPVNTPLAARLKSRQIMALGRLVPQKGFDLLLRAFAASRGPQLGWQLVIVGEGSQRAALSALAEQLGIREQVLLRGLVRMPAGVYAASPIFVLSSRYEGLPNALLEAMAHGCAVLCFDCPGGPAAVIRHQSNGLLAAAEDPQALAAGLDRLLLCENLRERLGVAAREDMRALAPQRVMSCWAELLTALSAPGSGQGRPTRCEK